MTLPAPLPPPGFTCPYCGATSHSPRDIAEEYCGACRTDFPLLRDMLRAWLERVPCEHVQPVAHAASACTPCLAAALVAIVPFPALARALTASATRPRWGGRPGD